MDDDDRLSFWAIVIWEIVAAFFVVLSLFGFVVLVAIQ